MNKITMNLSLFLILLAGCKIEKYEEAPESNGTYEIRGEELASLTRICESLSTKRAYFNTLSDGELQFNLRTKKRDCNDSTVFDLGPFRADLRVLIGGDPYLEAVNRSRYLNDVVNDKKGDLGIFCETLFSGAVVENMAYKGDLRLQVLASTNPTYDLFQLGKSRKDLNGEWKLFEIEKGVVITEKSRTTRNFLGILKERSIVKSCMNGPDQLFIQSFTSF